MCDGEDGRDIAAQVVVATGSRCAQPRTDLGPRGGLDGARANGVSPTGQFAQPSVGHRLIRGALETVDERRDHCRALFGRKFEHFCQQMIDSCIHVTSVTLKVPGQVVICRPRRDAPAGAPPVRRADVHEVPHTRSRLPR